MEGEEGYMYDKRGEDNERIGRIEGEKEEDEEVVQVERKAKKREKGGEEAVD